MTLTKVGTAKYVEAELLRKDNCTEIADIFSLSITFCESIIWSDPYPTCKFKFRWRIGNFIEQGRDDLN